MKLTCQEKEYLNNQVKDKNLRKFLAHLMLSGNATYQKHWVQRLQQAGHLCAVTAEEELGASEKYKRAE
jgi:hypothetical protein